MTVLDARNPAVRTARLAALARLQRYAKWLDASIGIPGTRWKMGVESLVGLVPGVGDSIGLVLSLWVLWVAWRHGVRTGTFLRMVWNVTLESVLGTVPVAGDVFDIWFRANLRNVALLEEEWEGDAPD